ncbi:MAG: beta-N-acetylhexosaminidase [Candidatus Heimdallarchaeaceae archaeon]
MIPQPYNLKLEDGKFIFNPETKIFVPVDLLAVSLYLKQMIKKPTGFDLVDTKQKSELNSINLELDDSLKDLNPEGYLLQISPENIHIRAPQPAGVFYGIQTLRQLLPLEIESQTEIKNIEWDASCLIIEDFPRFKWRGMMFDSGRHFFKIDVIKKHLDLLALLKMNTFHWHLTEDQGWRIEIKKYPKLTEIGSKREDSRIGGWTSKKTRGEPHEGFYTQDEIREVIQYAEERFIRVIPEIDVPGHSSAAIAAYPELSCTKEKINVPTKFGIFKDIYCAGQDYTYEFMENVLDEVLSLFPSEIIHIGGDEVPKKNWKKCDVCKNKMKEEKLRNLDELHAYFTERISKYIISKGRRVIGWNEILDEHTDKNTIGQHWLLTGKKQVRKHLEKGGDIVVSNMFRYYLDYSYLMTPLRKTYKFEPISKAIKPEYRQQILGIESPIWTEWVSNTDRLGWQVLPRLVAVAETGWTQKKFKNFKNFRIRIENFEERLNSLEFNFASLNEANPGNLKRLFKLRKAFKWPKI